EHRHVDGDEPLPDHPPPGQGAQEAGRSVPVVFAVVNAHDRPFYRHPVGEGGTHFLPDRPRSGKAPSVPRRPTEGVTTHSACIPGPPGVEWRTPAARGAAMASTWYYAQGGQQFGPVSSRQLKRLAAGGQLRPTDLIWKDGMADWTPALKLKGLFRAAEQV